MSDTARTTARVDERHLAVPVAVVDPVVVTFDGQYVWSFSPSRDGVRARGAWEVAWPESVRPLLEGTAHVRLGDVEGRDVHFDDDVCFGGSASALVLRDRNGHALAVDRAGHLSRVFSETDDTTKRHIAEGAARALHDLREKVGIDAHISYGCLLGAVRDGRMIGHDSDADLAYVSRYTHPADIMRESFRMERELRELGWHVVRMSGADLKLLVRLPDRRVVHVDVFGAFHVGETFYQMGGRSGRLPRAALTPASTVVLEGVELAAPADPAQVLAFLYGAGWRTPDPSFKNVDPVVGLRRLLGWFGGGQRHLAQWNQLLRDRRPDILRRPSSFGRWVGERIPEGTLAVDVGCGLGRDSRHLARQGHDVVALDYSHVATGATRRVLRRRGIASPDVRKLFLNDLRSVLLTGAELAHDPRLPHLLARGLLECLDAEARAHLWVLCSMSLRRGGSVHLEFSATRPGLLRGGLDGLTRRVRTSRVVREIEAAGGRVVHLEHGPGTDLLEQHDPHVARLEARWSTTPATGERMFKDEIEETTDGSGYDWRSKALALPTVIGDLKASVQENRRLNRRVAELTDIVAELLVPLADRDPERARELLASYRKSTLGA